MEPKGFLIYFDRDSACALSNFWHKQYNTPPITWTKIIQSMVFTEYPHEGIVFILSFVRAMQYPSKIF
jgi:hypothetical protein